MQDAVLHILLANEQSLLRDGIRLALNAMSPNALLYDAETFDEACTVATEAGGLDLMLVSNSLPGLRGSTGIEAFRQKFPSAKLVLMAALVEPLMTMAAIGAGVDGVVPMTISGGSMVHALRLILSGEVYFPAKVLMQIAKLATTMGASAALHGLDGVRPIRFSASESQVIPRLLDGMPNKVIAECLRIDEAAVKSRLRGIFRKIGASNRTQAVCILLASGHGRPLLAIVR